MNRIFVKCIFLDVDGTLISFNTHKVPQSAISALNKAYNKGVKIIIATGRPFTDLKELKDVPYDAVAALNGSYCVLRDGTPVATKPITQADFDKVRALARKYDFPLAIENNRGFFIDKVNQRVIDLARLVDHEVPEVVDLDEEFRREVCCQVCIYCDETVEKKIMAELPGLTVSRWNPYFADVNVAGVDKSVGVDAFCKYYGFSRDEVMAIGDGGNDIPMLKAAGIGVAMGEASDAVKAAADYVTDSVDDNGIYNALSHFGVALTQPRRSDSPQS